MVSAADEALVLLSRPTRRIVVEEAGPLERGLRDLRPKRLNYAKLVATLVRQLLDKNPSRPVASATVLMPLMGGDAEAILDLLPDIPRLTLAAPLFSSALDQIASLSGRMALAVVGDADPPEADAHQALARALVTHDRAREQKLAEKLIKGAPVDPKREHLVVEERPGKAQPLDLERLTLKHAARRFDPGKEIGRAPLATPAGFGAGGIILSDDDQSGKGRAVSIASLDWRPPAGGLSLDTMKVLKEAAELWLASLGVDPLQIKRLVVSAPWLAVSGFIGQAMTAKDVVEHPDQLYGWQPLMTLLGFLDGGELPALLVFSGRHHTVHLVAVWS